MKKLPSWARLSPEEFQRRITALQTKYTQKELSKLLGVSVRSINYYQKGESFPRSQEKYQAINQLYNQKKSEIAPKQVEKRVKERVKRTKAQKYGRVKFRYASIYPEYMFYSPAKEFEGVKNWDFLEELSEKGYVAGWKGRDIIPLEVMFTLGEESLNKRFGKVVRIVAVVSRKVSPKQDNEFTGMDTEVAVFPTYYRMIPGLKPSDSWEDKLDKIRAFIMETNIERGYIVALLGYYFDEEDDI